MSTPIRGSSWLPLALLLLLASAATAFADRDEAAGEEPAAEATGSEAGESGAGSEPDPEPESEADEGTRRPSTVVVHAGERPRWRGEPITLSLRDADLEEVLRSIARITGINLVLHPKVEGSVTVELHEVPWDQALDVILKTQGLGYEIDGRVMNVGF